MRRTPLIARVTTTALVPQTGSSFRSVNDNTERTQQKSASKEALGRQPSLWLGWRGRAGTQWRAGVLVSLLLVPEAEAKEPFTWSALSFSGGVDYGDGSGVSGFGLGLNGRGGVTLDNGIYAGGVLEYFFGEEQVNHDIPESREDSHSWQLLAEGGYDFGVLDRLVIRPKLALGLSWWSYHRELLEERRATTTLDDNDPAFAIGTQFLTPLEPLQLSGEVRYNAYGGQRDAGALLVGVSVGSRL
jgi:hypothetical protein